MKIIILICLFINVITLKSKGQLNPVKNFFWEQKYDYTLNCFRLSWEKPDSSLNDTLVGYNIYRNNYLYKFTTSTEHFCDPCYPLPQTDFCDFISNGQYYENAEFYMHVTAVYNSSLLESNYIDSGRCAGIITDLKNKINKIDTKIKLYQKESLIKVEIINIHDNAILTIVNSLGQTEKEKIVTKNQNIIDIDCSDLINGIYFIKYKTTNENICEKIIIKNAH